MSEWLRSQTKKGHQNARRKRLESCTLYFYLQPRRFGHHRIRPTMNIIWCSPLRIDIRFYFQMSKLGSTTIVPSTRNCIDLNLSSMALYTFPQDTKIYPFEIFSQTYQDSHKASVHLRLQNVRYLGSQTSVGSKSISREGGWTHSLFRHASGPPLALPRSHFDNCSWCEKIQSKEQYKVKRRRLCK